MEQMGSPYKALMRARHLASEANQALRLRECHDFLLWPDGCNRSVEKLLHRAANLGAHGTHNDDDAVSL